MLKIIAKQFKKPSGFLGTAIANIMVKGNSPTIKAVIQNLDIQPYDKILEIGYGPGIGINLISKNVDKCSIYGIDFSELMYKRATLLNKQYIDSNKVKLLFGDFLETDISVNDFDKIFCINVVYFWNNLKKPFEKVRQLLKEGGIFYFYMANKDDLAKMKLAHDDIFNKYSIEQVIDALKLAGFSEVDYYDKRGYFIKAKK